MYNEDSFESSVLGWRLGCDTMANKLFPSYHVTVPRDFFDVRSIRRLFDVCFRLSYFDTFDGTGYAAVFFKVELTSNLSNVRRKFQLRRPESFYFLLALLG